MKVAELVYNSISPMFDDLDVKLVDVEYAKKFDNMHLTVYIDKCDGSSVTIEDCEKVSRLIDGALEELNPTKDESYCLDVSSYGLDKPLKFDWQFDKYLNNKVSVTLYKKVDGLKDFDAILKDYKQDYVFEIDGKEISISKDLVARVLPYIEF